VPRNGAANPIRSARDEGHQLSMSHLKTFGLRRVSSPAMATLPRIRDSVRL